LLNNVFGKSYKWPPILVYIMIKLVKTMYPCQDVPVIAFNKRCPNPCLYCSLCSKDFPQEEILASGFEDVLKEVVKYKGAYFSAISDCFLEENKDLTYELLRSIWEVRADFVPLIVTKQIIPDNVIDLLIENKHRVVVQVSIPSLDDSLLSILEPGAAKIEDRLQVVNELIAEGVIVTPVVMPFFDIGSEIELASRLSSMGVKRVILGLPVLTSKQKEDLKEFPLVSRLTEEQKTITQTGYVLPLDERVSLFASLIETFSSFDIKARVCSADNLDLENKGLVLCKKFRHPLF
jgi:hypothetical protein